MPTKLKTRRSNRPAGEARNKKTSSAPRGKGKKARSSAVKTKKTKSAARKRPAPGRKATRKAANTAPGTSLFRKLTRAYGSGVCLVLAERGCGKLRVKRGLLEFEAADGSAARGRKRPSELEKAGRTQLARICAGLGHAVRVQIVATLLPGPATYRELADLTESKPGPLYHHLNQLRLAGLLDSPGRDAYALTAAGRKAALTWLALSKLL